ncbi:hypothetical protein LOTGIDRAFT_155033 [Lottia gigantea]|uniref:DNA-directed DNA polymerase n=1 Tax=Lottia gigantea TaxID=225164 RepID=V3ZML2_LOTGI|nr:hypothetical protein LOTGIDRAFT_155033 [Lottia gigantea]ESO85547.1 hypothetical protein LOTGIDRAFT_155033 [Lottia gigantea]
MDKKSDASDWYFTGKIILMKDNFQEIKRSRVGRGGTDLLKKINEYEDENCYIPTDGYCFIKCVNRVLNKDLTCKFQEYISGFSKANRKGVMTCARKKEFNKKFNTSFQIYNPKNRNFHPRDVHDELDWVFYLHNSHFCLIRRSQKSLGIQEIEDNYEQVWKTCRDDNAVTQVSPLKLKVLSSMSDDAFFAWDCETYSEKDTRREIPYACTLINLEKLRKKLEIIKDIFQNINPTDNVPEEFYDKLMNVVELFGWYYLYHYDKEMVEEEWYETTRMVAKHTEKENIEKVYSHTNPFIRNFIRRSIKGGRVSANRKSFETNKMDEICNVLKEYISQTESNNIIDLYKEYSASTKDKTEVHSRLKKIECTKLMAFDANGLYASAMSDLDSEYPRAESGRAFLPEEEKEFVKLFNKQKFRPRTAILTVWFDYPKNMFFQPIPTKDKITFTNKEGKKETGNKIRFRNGFCHDVLTSVYIQEIVKASGRIIRILDGIVYKENYKTPPYRDYILILRDLRNKYKREGNIVGSNYMKLLGNSLYGKSIQEDIFTTRHLWNEATLIHALKPMRKLMILNILLKQKLKKKRLLPKIVNLHD